MTAKIAAVDDLFVHCATCGCSLGCHADDDGEGNAGPCGACDMCAEFNMGVFDE